MSKASEIGSNVFGVVAGLYFFVSQIMSVYFWWQYAKVDNFLITITLDVFIAELKGFLWIFFIW
jgi:6-phosphogluconate dehydrogenase